MPNTVGLAGKRSAFLKRFSGVFDTIGFERIMDCNDRIAQKRTVCAGAIARYAVVEINRDI